MPFALASRAQGNRLGRQCGITAGREEEDTSTGTQMNCVKYHSRHIHALSDPRKVSVPGFLTCEEGLIAPNRSGRRWN